MLLPFALAFGLAVGFFRAFEAWTGCRQCTTESGPLMLTALFLLAAFWLVRWREQRLRQALRVDEPQRKSVGSTSMTR